VTTVHLYDLANARAILDEFLAETEGEVTPALEELIEQLDGDVTDKVERVALYIREQLATAAAVKEEEARLAARRKSHERAAEGLKNYLQRQLERLGKTRVDGVLCTVALQPSPPSVDPHAHDSSSCRSSGTPRGRRDRCVPSSPRRDPGQYALDKRRRSTAYAGQRFPDGVSIEQSAHLRIR
jgi:hypothetical protein